MSKHPVNLLIRFLMEIAALIIMGIWGWHIMAGWERYLFAIGIPTIAAAIWGIFRIPNDPNPAPIEVPGMVRLGYEWLFFGFSIWALYDLGYMTIAWVMVIVTVVSYVSGYDRTLKMLMNKT